MLLALTDACRAKSYSLIKLRLDHQPGNRCVQLLPSTATKTRQWMLEKVKMGSQGRLMSSLLWSDGNRQNENTLEGAAEEILLSFMYKLMVG